MTTKASKANTTPAIIAMFFLFAMISFVTGFQNPFGVILKNQLSLSALQSQLGNLANFIAYAFMGIPAGILLQRKGYKFSAIASVLVGLLGVAIMFVSSYLPDDAIFAVYLIGAFVAGFSMCMLNTVVNPMLNTLGGGGNKGNQLIQFGGSLNSLAATICPILVGYLMGNVTNSSLVDARPALYIAGGIFILATIVLIFTNIPEPILDAIKEEEKVKKETAKQAEPTLSGALRFRHFVLGAIAIFIYVGVEVGIPNMANLYMTNDVKIAASAAGVLVGMYWFLMLIGRFVGGIIGGKVSSRAMLSTVAAIGMIFILLACICDPATTIAIPAFDADFNLISVDAPINILFLVLCGLCTSVMWGGIFNLAVEGLGKYTAVASGFFMVMVCGGGIIPLVQGGVADACGYLSSYWVLFAGLAYILYYALIGHKNVNKNISTEA